MSQNQAQKKQKTPRYGIKTLDLAEARDSPGEMIQTRGYTYIGAIAVPDECYLRLGRENASRIDMRNLNNIMVEPFDNVYVENPAGAGELQVTFSNFPISTAGVLREVTEITGSVQSDVSDRAARDLGKVDVAGADTTLPTDVSDRSVRELGKARLEDSGGVLVDPLDDAEMQPVSATTATAGAANAASVDAGSYRTTVTASYDLSGAATVTVEVSADSAAWHPYDSYTSSAAETGSIDVNTGYRYVRIYADTAVNELAVGGKGV